MRIALLVALAYLAFIPFIIDLVDARPRRHDYYKGTRDRSLREFPHKNHGNNYRYASDESLPFFPSQVTCVFLITLAVRVSSKLNDASRLLAALQKIREGKEGSAGTS